MMIDFHAHVFPDKVAPYVISELKTKGGFDVCSDGTVAGLTRYMAGTGLTHAVAMGVAVRPDLVTKTNDWLMSIKDDAIIPFGSVHPDYAQPHQEIDRLRQNGIKGLKFHSPFQQFRPDEERMMPIYEAMGEDMVAFFHVGSGLSKDNKPVLATPESLIKVMENFPKLKLVAAHFGGFQLLEQAQRYLVGRNLYLDTSWPPSLKAIGSDAIVQIINRHGAEKILFGSDCPTADPVSEIQFIDSLKLSDREKELILGENACNLLGLED